MSIFINIDGVEVKGHRGQTVLELATSIGIEIPTLCHDERVEIYGSCGVCVVEDERSGRLLRSCSTFIQPGMVVSTSTDKVRSSRKTALELLLSDHRGDCKAPCTLACPAGTDCQGYVGLVANGAFHEASMVLKDVLPLPASIGRVCPHPCEDACRRELVEAPIAIANIKSFIADKDLERLLPYMPETGRDTGKSVCIIGGGPGGLSAAYFLRQWGHQVSILDMMPEMGGMLRYGIPEYRLPGAVIDDEVAMIESMGVEMINHVKVGRDFTLDYLKNTYDAVIVAIGAWESSDLRCPGEDLKNVVGGIDFLREVSLNETMLLGKRIAVVGGGNTAMDVVRTAVRLGATEVYNIYRRTKAEMPAETIEILEAEEEGVIFKNLTNPIEVIGKDGKVDKIRLQIMELGEEDATGRRSPMAVPGKEEILDVDMVIVAIGQKPALSGFETITTTDWNTIKVDEGNFYTNEAGVFAIGDVVNAGADIAIRAIGHARIVADIVDGYLNGEELVYEEPFMVTQEKTSKDFSHEGKHKRVDMRHLTPEERKDNFLEVNFGYSDEEAMEEARRCLECGCHDYFECKLIKYAQAYEVEPSRFKGEMHHRNVDNSHPFILRDPDKCILCSLCVRICDEQMENTALGLVDRGFDTMVSPAMSLPLKETGCISCGQCVHVCPTGALQEKRHMDKKVPVDEVETESHCTFCSVGCSNKISSFGDMILRTLPTENSMLCSKGRFGFEMERKLEKIEEAQLKIDSAWVSDDYNNLFVHTVKKMQGIRAQYGADAIAIAISDRYTNEEIAGIKKMAIHGFKTDNIFSFNKKTSGMAKVLGKDHSTTTFEEMLESPVIVLLSKDMDKTHTLASMHIRDAVRNGAKLITIGKAPDILKNHAMISIEADSIEPIQALVWGVMKEKNLLGSHHLNELEAFVKNADISAEKSIEEALALLLSTPKATYVFAENEITKDAAMLFTELASLMGHIGKRRTGVLNLRANSNSQGLANQGIRSRDEAIQAIETGRLKGLIIFGEDVDVDLSGLEFVAVQDAYATKTAEAANLVFPGSPFAASAGHITRTDGKTQGIEKVIHHHVDNQDVIWALCLATGYDLADNVDKLVDNFYYETRNDDLDISYPAPSTTKLFEDETNTNILFASFTDFLEREKIKL